MKGRGLSAEEKALWGRVVATVRPLHPIAMPVHSHSADSEQPAAPVASKNKAKGRVPRSPRIAVSSVKAPAQTPHGLDSHWERRFQKGGIIPDVSIDLHGRGLASAHQRLDAVLEQAIQQQLRVVLLVTGKARAHDRASGSGRGAIAAVVRDWLAASRHAGSIAAVRNAHPRHGGDGALYIVLKR